MKKPMLLTTSLVTKHLVTNVQDLDPVSVYLEDLGKGVGRVTIVCFDACWTYCWGGMGDHLVKDFLLRCDNHYLANKFMSGNIQKPNLEETVKAAKVYLATRVTEGDVSPNRAKDIIKVLNQQEYLPTTYTDTAIEVWQAVYGPEFYDYFATALTSEANHLYRVLDTIKEAISTAPPTTPK